MSQTIVLSYINVGICGIGSLLLLKKGIDTGGNMLDGMTCTLAGVNAIVWYIHAAQVQKDKRVLDEK